MSFQLSAAPESLWDILMLPVSTGQGGSVVSRLLVHHPDCRAGFESYFGCFAGRLFHLLSSIPPAV